MLSMVTGVGAKGQVGAVVAARLVERGDQVLFVARTEAEASEMSQTLGASGYVCDLTDGVAVARLAAEVRARHGDRLDALVNVAGGFGMTGPLAEGSFSTFEQQMAINLATAFHATQAFLPMLEAAQGSVVYFASEAVLEGSATSGMAGYAAAKAGVVALMRSLADEYRGRVRANALAPAAIRTSANVAMMGEGARFVEREDVAAAVAFLTSSEAGAITGQVVRLG